MESELTQYANDVKTYFSILKESINIFKSAKDLLPDSPEKEMVSKSIEEAETKAKVAEAGIAKSLGFHLCPKCWPPEIIVATSVSSSSDNYICHKCKSTYIDHGTKRKGKFSLRETRGNQTSQQEEHE